MRCLTKEKQMSVPEAAGEKTASVRARISARYAECPAPGQSSDTTATSMIRSEDVQPERKQMQRRPDTQRYQISGSHRPDWTIALR